MPTSHVRHPSPVNQFYRLEFDELTRKYVKRSRWNHTHVINGIVRNYDGVLCMAAGGAVALDAHTGGGIRTSPGVIHDRQSDRSGGIGVDDVAKAWASFGHTFLTPDYCDRYGVVDLIQELRHVEIGVDYRKVPYDLQVQKGGQFDHAISLDDISGSQVFRYDSLDVAGRWTLLEPYLVAAEALALRVRGTKKRLFVGVTKVRPAMAMVYHVDIRPLAGHKTRAYGLFSVKNGVITGIEMHTTPGFSVLAEARHTYPWPGHPSQDLVRITSTGKLNGRWVRSHWTREV